MKMRRVAVTGMGVISPLGDCVADLFANLVAARSGIRMLPSAIGQGLRSPIAATVSWDPAAHFPIPRARMLDRVSQFALVAAARAVADARLDFLRELRERCGVCVGTGMGGAETTEEGYRTLYAEQSDRIKPFTVIAAMVNAAASWIGIEYALAGPTLTYSTACSSSAVAIGEAANRIRCGAVDVMLAGGTEAPLTRGTLMAWDAMRTLATPDSKDPATSCRPFSKTRTGLVLGEGAAFFVLESWEHAVARGASVRAEITGYGLTTDGTHITRPSAEGQASAMRAALQAAELPPEAIDYVNAHGTATAQNDAIETRALKQVFGARAYRLPVSSTKSMHGHLLGAAGALEFAVSIAALERGIVPPTANLDSPDPECDLNYVADGALNGMSLRAVMSNSFAFGGTNAVLIASAVDRW